MRLEQPQCLAVHLETASTTVVHATTIYGKAVLADYSLSVRPSDVSLKANAQSSVGYTAIAAGKSIGPA